MASTSRALGQGTARTMTEPSESTIFTLRVRRSTADPREAEARGNMMKKIHKREARPRCLRRQRDVLCDVMLSAGQCETWLTLHELGRLTGYGEASVSAQLRHLRKPEFGSYEVDKRQRSLGKTVRGETGPLWEYRLRRKVRVVSKRMRRVSISAAQLGALR